jgi:hypothetical protein
MCVPLVSIPLALTAKPVGRSHAEIVNALALSYAISAMASPKLGVASAAVKKSPNAVIAKDPERLNITVSPATTQAFPNALRVAPTENCLVETATEAVRCRCMGTTISERGPHMEVNLSTADRAKTVKKFAANVGAGSHHVPVATATLRKVAIHAQEMDPEPVPTVICLG